MCTRGLASRFKDLDKWIITEDVFDKLPAGWEVCEIGKIVSKIKEREKVLKDQYYDMVGVKWYGKGIFNRETVLGKEMSSSYVYPLEPGTLVYNRLFAWKGSFAIIPENTQDKYVSNEFPRYQVNKKKILPEFLYLFCLTDKMQKEILRRSVGSSAVSRNRLREETFESIEIVLPPLSVQKDIISEWTKLSNKVSDVEQRISYLKKSIEDSILRSLNINIEQPKLHKGGFAVNWKNMNRWDTFYFRKDFIELEKSINESYSDVLGNIINFTTRPWKADMFSEDIVKYIEISCVDRDYGITRYREINKNKPPSRATTLIKSGDIMISTTRPYLGAFTIVPEEFNNCVCSSGFSIADKIDESRVNKEFLMFFLKSQAGLRQMEQRMTGGLYPAITQHELEKIIIPLPDLTVQEQIICELKSTQQQIYDKQKELALLNRQLNNYLAYRF